MAEGGHSDDEVPADDNQFNDMDEILLVEFRPLYVNNTTIRVEDERRINPLPIRITRRYNAEDARFVLNLVQTALAHFSQQPLTRHSRLLSMMDWHADYCSVRLDASGESVQVGFYPAYINTPPETSVSESSTDDEQPGPSNLLNSRKARAGGSRTSADQISDCQVKIRQGVNRKRKTSDWSESREWKRKRLDHWSNSGSSRDSLRSGFPSPGSLEETSRDNEQPGPSHRENSEARASADQISQDESRQGVKRKRKRSELLETQSKRRKSDHQSDSSINSLVSESSRMYVSTPPAACGKTKSSNRDDEQDELPQLVNNSVVRTEGSRAPSEQGSGSQVEVRRSFKRKRKTSGRSESRGSKRKRLDHRSDADSNDDQPGPSVRANNED